MPISEEELDFAVGLAFRAAQCAASIIEAAFDDLEGTPLETTAKSSPVDIVTQYDKHCEKEVLAILSVGTPQYDILSEETHSDTCLTDKPTWVVDPIDGTTSFAHGLFDCCVSIALVVDKQPVFGVVNAPRLGEVYSAVRGRGAFCNGQRIRVSPTRSLSEAVVFLHQSNNRSEAVVKSVVAMQKELASLPVHAVRNYGSAALDMCFVASGRAELYLEVGLHAWDLAAGAVILREAGGVVHDIDKTDSLDITSRGMCCANALEISQLGVELAKRHNYTQQTFGI